MHQIAIRLVPYYKPTLFEMEDPKFDATKTQVNGKKFVLERKDVNGDGVINIDDLQWEYLEGDGDFRSAEVTSLRDEADIILTNPPFSLFRPFMTWLFVGQTRFSVIGNMNAITYNEVFPHIMGNRLWYGPVSPAVTASSAFRLITARCCRDSRGRAWTEVHPSQGCPVVHEHRPRTSSRTSPADVPSGQH